MTPSKRRRMGREAFIEGWDPIEECPFKDLSCRSDWIEGWNEELANFNADQTIQEEKDIDPIRIQIKNANDLEELKEALLEMYDAM